MGPTEHYCHALVEVSGLSPLPRHSHEILLFSKCRNESLRLPAFLRHYRNLGVNRFFIVDNESTDGSTEYLVTQPDVLSSARPAGSEKLEGALFG